MRTLSIPRSCRGVCARVERLMDAHPRGEERPFVTLSWAQSLDGSISRVESAPLSLSGRESREVTHALRAQHEAILVGINTVLSDDPQLTTRLVDGPSPQPVVLDSHLELPISSKIFQRNTGLGGDRPPIVVVDTQFASLRGERARRLRDHGAIVIEGVGGREGGVDLKDALQRLLDEGVRSVMVEGGGRVLRSFIESGCVDLLVVTVAPRFVTGYQPFRSPKEDTPLRHIQLEGSQWHLVGNDAILTAGVSYDG